MWYNYRTEKFTDTDPTDETIADYLPQDPSALALYRLYRQGSLPLLDAMENVLLINVGEEPRHEPVWPSGQEREPGA